MNYIATIGNFDGIHIGHQMLIQNVLMQAEEKKLRSLLYTFNVHTKGSRELILNPKDKVLFLQQMGLEKVKLLNFESIRKMTPREFVFHLSEQKIKELIVGEDFRFGVHASGNAEILKELCAQKDITVMIFPSVYIGNEKISSTYLREELKLGKLEKVNPFLYQNFFITSKIVGG
ncbi:MAG: FAD synthetase family protein, partial [Tissierellia bacterium]|nr:FAD synthetase family protein [Tissierellia bacterium]